MAEIAESTEFITQAQSGQPGLTAEYFASADLSGAPLLTRVERNVNYNAALFGSDGSLAAQAHAVRWTGYYAPRGAGDHHFVVTGNAENSGYRLYLDDKLLIDTWQRALAAGNQDSSAWLDRVPALLQAWYPGQEGGAALAQLLFGEYSPSGRLPVTFERRWEDNATYRSYYPQDPAKKDVQYREGVFVGYR